MKKIQVFSVIGKNAISMQKGEQIYLTSDSHSGHISSPDGLTGLSQTGQRLGKSRSAAFP